MEKKLSLLDIIDSAKFVLDQTELSDNEKAIALDKIFKFNTGFSALDLIDDLVDEHDSLEKTGEQEPSHIRLLNLAEHSIHSVIEKLGYKSDYKLDD